MTAKELTLFGKALKALMEVGAMEQVREIIDYMATADKPVTKEKEDKE